MLDFGQDRNHPHLGRGFAYIDFSTADEAETAMKHMDGGQIDGQEITAAPVLNIRPALAANRPVRRSPPPPPRRRRGWSPRPRSPYRRRSPPPRARRASPPRRRRYDRSSSSSSR